MPMTKEGSIEPMIHAHAHASLWSTTYLGAQHIWEKPIFVPSYKQSKQRNEETIKQTNNEETKTQTNK